MRKAVDQKHLQGHGGVAVPKIFRNGHRDMNPVFEVLIYHTFTILAFAFFVFCYFVNTLIVALRKSIFPVIVGELAV